MPRHAIHLLLTLVVALSASCSGHSSDTGSAQFAVSVPQALNANISRVSVTSSAADFPSISVDLAPTNGVWGGIIGNIPVGANRSFLAQAFNAAGTLLFEGSATGVTISANQSTLVAITLQQVNPLPPFQNEAPVIDSLVASATTVTAGSSISLQATVHDPNPRDSLSYAWTSTAGTFSAASALSTSWTAPATTGLQELTFTVTDSGGLASIVSIAVNIVQAGGQGDARLSISFNSSPQVTSISATPTRIAVGQATSVSASASDSDGDALAYSWSATCAGSWTNASSNSAQFTPSAQPAGACNNCRLSVSVADGRGGQTTGTVALCVSNAPPSNHFPPTIIRSYRSSDTATPGQVLTYEVVAEDPESTALTFSWAATSGTLGAPVHTATNSRITWTAPTCAGTNPTITVTVRNAFNLTAMRSFAVLGLPSCSSGWTATGPMASPRRQHSATLLPNGKVLVSGGESDNGALATAELYDPTTGTWSATGSMAFPRTIHRATLLPNGKVLVSGGLTTNGFLATAELYDPTFGTWTPTGSMAIGRYAHTTTLLPNGKVLVSGGNHTSATAEVYDPASGTWITTGPTLARRSFHSAKLLPNGKVLVTGGYNTSYHATAELYDPASGTWSATGSMAGPRATEESVLLTNEKVFVAAGATGNGALATAEIFDFTLGTWSTVGSMAVARYNHPTTLLSNDKILVSGGYNSSTGVLSTAEFYDSASGTWSAAGTMLARRELHTATLLLNGQVLVVGGYGNRSLATAELYTP